MATFTVSRDAGAGSAERPAARPYKLAARLPAAAHQRRMLAAAPLRSARLAADEPHLGADQRKVCRLFRSSRLAAAIGQASESKQLDQSSSSSSSFVGSDGGFGFDG